MERNPSALLVPPCQAIRRGAAPAALSAVCSLPPAAAPAPPEERDLMIHERDAADRPAGGSGEQANHDGDRDHHGIPKFLSHRTVCEAKDGPAPIGDKDLIFA